MKIKSINIKNFKSIVDITINEPNPFTVFVGPNGSGKSNIFEALEFMNVISLNAGEGKSKIEEIESKFGDMSEFITNFYLEEEPITIEIGFENFAAGFFRIKNNNNIPRDLIKNILSETDFRKFIVDIIKELNYGIEKPLSEKQINKRLGELRLNNTQFESAFLRGLLLLDSQSIDYFNSLNSKSIDDTFFQFIIKNQVNHTQKTEFNQFIHNFSRVFPSQKDRIKIKYKKWLNSDGSNLIPILKKILLDKDKNEEFKNWLDLFIPEFEHIEIGSDLKGKSELRFYEKFSKISISPKLISDGTFNIVALLTAVYQSDEPQFLCIEEPENGLNPYVVRKLVDLFRNACEEKGHYIWINTHSQTLVECLQPEEIIVVDKINGETQVKQIKDMNLHGLDMAEVWLSGALGGGTPW